mgnify:CR=1 FL=1
MLPSSMNKPLRGVGTAGYVTTFSKVYIANTDTGIILCASKFANWGNSVGGIGVTEVNITTFVHSSQDHFNDFFYFFS